MSSNPQTKFLTHVIFVHMDDSSHLEDGLHQTRRSPLPSTHSLHVRVRFPHRGKQRCGRLEFFGTFLFAATIAVFRGSPLFGIDTFERCERACLCESACKSSKAMWGSVASEHRTWRSTASSGGRTAIEITSMSRKQWWRMSKFWSS
eukprot:TRINITY_DN1539_c0_g1_i2.p3 TRINITY_DN1539_c0_g1~~TRINITY_DN1539_c0_g1_i2.p3  ORF type:complete len:147 (-),score=13.94 TRINITY_DN1539_c0_g1_i2:168-608(-)